MSETECEHKGKGLAVMSWGACCKACGEPHPFDDPPLGTYTHVSDLLGLFRNGYDSLEISYIAGLPEPTVYNQSA